jgi:hypothetical protein
MTFSIHEKNIKIFLTDGTSTGVKTAEIDGFTIKAVSFSSRQIKSLLKDSKYPEAHKPGVYFLFGTDEETDDPKVYIGKAEKISERLTTHLNNPKKGFWNEEIIFFVSKDSSMTIAHAGYLESKLFKIADSINRGYQIENIQTPKPSSLPQSDIGTTERFLNDIRLLMGVLGHKLLEDVITNSKTTETNLVETETPRDNNQISVIPDNLKLFLEPKTIKIKARAIQTNEGIVVLEGSEAVLENKSPYTWHEQLRAKLIADKILKLVSDKYIFQKDTLFKTASSAAAIVLGNSANGLTSWKNADGKDLKTIENERMGAEN